MYKISKMLINFIKILCNYEDTNFYQIITNKN